MSVELDDAQGLETNMEHTPILERWELFFEDNKKNLSYVLGGLAILVAGYFGYKMLILEPQEKEAEGQMFYAQRYFEADSLKKAIDGDGNNMGFKTIADEYSGTKSGNLAKYYLGLASLKKGDYQGAIDALESYKANDIVTKPLAIGAIGDAQMELGKVDEAIAKYMEAAKCENKFTEAVFLKKAALAYESQNKYAEALEQYKKIKKDCADTPEAQEADKYIARAQANIK